MEHRCCPIRAQVFGAAAWSRIFFLDDLVTPDRDGVRSSLTGDVVTGDLSPVILDALGPGCRAG